MIKVSEDTIFSFAKSIEHTEDRDKYSEEFWDRLEEDNPAILDYVMGFCESLELDEQRAYYLDGILTVYELFRRQIEAQEML
jgi:hypothetical protein